VIGPGPGESGITMHHERSVFATVDRRAGPRHRTTAGPLALQLALGLACAVAAAAVAADNGAVPTPSPTAASLQIIEIGPDGARVIDLPITPGTAAAPAVDAATGTPASEAKVAVSPPAPVSEPAAAQAVAKQPVMVEPAVVEPPVEVPAVAAEAPPAMPSASAKTAVAAGRPDGSELPASVDAGAIHGLIGDAPKPSTPATPVDTAPSAPPPGDVVVQSAKAGDTPAAVPAPKAPETAAPGPLPATDEVAMTAKVQDSAPAPADAAAATGSSTSGIDKTLVTALARLRDTLSEEPAPGAQATEGPVSSEPAPDPAQIPAPVAAPVETAPVPLPEDQMQLVRDVFAPSI
jgi:hypothetical protein